jgi:hypothetical protein
MRVELGLRGPLYPSVNTGQAENAEILKNPENPDFLINSAFR